MNMNHFLSVLYAFFRFGRKRATQTSVMLMLVSSTATGLCPNIYLFLVSYLIVGIGYGGYRLNASILGTVCNMLCLILFSSVNVCKL